MYCINCTIISYIKCIYIYITVKDFVKYECEEINSVESVVKYVYEEVLCESGESNINTTINENSNKTEIASIDFDCEDDLADTTNEDIDSDSENVITLHAICDLEPPGERDLYLAIDQCFLLSNNTVTTTTTSTDNGTTSTSTSAPFQQALYAKLDCDFTGKTKFVTKLYIDNALCEGDPDVERIIEILECEPWLYENETNFGFEIKASVKRYIHI